MAKVSLSQNLHGIRPTSNGLYEIKEGDITYSMALSEFHTLKQYFRREEQAGHLPSVAGWYARLSKWEKRKVLKHGEPASDEGFWPDVEHPWTSAAVPLIPAVICHRQMYRCRPSSAFMAIAAGRFNTGV